MRSIPLRLWVLALLSAILQILPFSIAGPVPLWRRVFCWFCLVPLLYALLGSDRAGKPLRIYQAALLGYGCGVFWYAGNCYWIYRTMHIYGNIPPIPSFGILILFSLYLGLYLALFGAIVAALHAKYCRNAVLLASPFIWVAVELARARITGFPWDLLGYTQVDNLLLTRLAPWTGVMGISFVIAVGNALWLMRPATIGRLAKYVPTATALLLMAIATLAAAHKPSTVLEPAQAVATLLQENLSVGSEAIGNKETKQDMLASFAQLSLHPAIELSSTVHEPHGSPLPQASQIIIWPEAPTEFIDTDPILRHSISDLARQANAAVIVNDVTVASYKDGRPSLYNSASFFQPNGSYAGRYDKMHLVPFGEYTPYKPLFFFVGDLLDDLLFIPGTNRSVFSVADKKYGVFICYESIFGDELRHFPLQGAQVLVNISDDGWYGDTSAPWEHLDMARMRAIENHRWLLRATNTGITAAIDPEGRITATIPRHIRTSVQVPFGYENDLTFYSRYGDWFAWLCTFGITLLLLLGLPRKRFIAQSQVN
jgi:apolipoprotein N-acyltransferase